MKQVEEYLKPFNETMEKNKNEALNKLSSTYEELVKQEDRQLKEIKNNVLSYIGSRH